MRRSEICVGSERSAYRALINFSVTFILLLFGEYLYKVSREGAAGQVVKYTEGDSAGWSYRTISTKAANWPPLLFLYSVHFKRCGNSGFELPQILLGKVGDNLQIVGAKILPHIGLDLDRLDVVGVAGLQHDIDDQIRFE